MDAEEGVASVHGAAEQETMMRIGTDHSCGDWEGRLGGADAAIEAKAAEASGHR